jgi:hypothetical protein
MAKEKIECLLEVKFFTTESYVVKRINERGLKPYMKETGDESRPRHILYSPGTTSLTFDERSMV